MVLSRAFVLLSITLCLAACSCAYADDVSKEGAEKAVAGLQKLTKEKLEEAQQKDKDAKLLKENVESQKEKAKKAASEAAEAAKGNEEAKAFAKKAQSELEEILKMHESAKTKAEEVLPVMENLTMEAAVVNKEAQMKIWPNANSQNNFSVVIERVKGVEVRFAVLVENFKAAEKKFDDAKVELLKLEDHARKAQVAKHQAQAVVSVEKMESLLSNADADIKNIQQKKASVDATVKEINEAFDKTPKKLIQQISGFRDNVKGDLSQISDSVKQVQEDKKAMLDHKKNADEFLASIKKETDENIAQKHLQAITTHTEQAAESLKKINKAVSSADAHVKNANKQKEEMLKIFWPNDKKPGQLAKNGENKSAGKEGMYALGGSHDSAMTVCFSLLLAFIACAALN